MSQKPVEPNITYFRPGQLIFQVNGNLGSQEKRIESLIDWAKEHAKDKEITLTSSYRVFDFNAVEEPYIPSYAPVKPKSLGSGKPYESPKVEPQPSFSLVFVEAQSEKWPKSSMSQEAQESPEHRKMTSEALEDLLDLAILLDEKRKDAPEDLEGVSPNWLMSGSPSGPGSTGGPGGRPTPYEGQANNQEFKFAVLPEILALHVSGRDEPGTNVVVAILDTAPKLNDEDKDSVLDWIYSKWVGKVPENGQSLLRTLLGPDGKLQEVHYDDDVDQPIPGVWPGGYIQAEDHDYEMTDHGLFVAGIIHSIAPQAKIHLFQVLNRYGVGDLQSIAQALQMIQNDHETFPKDRLLINLSLTINIPLEKAHGKNDTMLQKIMKNKAWSERQGQIIERICNSLYARGSKVIAAAGNQGKNQYRPRACYPAAFESVLGVGALPKSEKPDPVTKKFHATSYSNRSDRPERTGITTLGGEEGEEQGILGIYLEEFPESQGHPQPSQSSNGWGWWAGTSFATPIITGMIAALRSFVPGLNTMEDAVVELFNVQSSKTDLDEDVIYVTQGRATIP
jgi:hypothetical protein